MNATDRVRNLKKFLESMEEELKASNIEGVRTGVEFSFGSAKGGVSATESLTFIQAIRKAVSAFDEDMFAQLSFEFEIVHPTQEEIAKRVAERMKAVVELQANAPKLVTA